MAKYTALTFQNIDLIKALLSPAHIRHPLHSCSVVDPTPLMLSFPPLSPVVHPPSREHEGLVGDMLINAQRTLTTTYFRAVAVAGSVTCHFTSIGCIGRKVATTAEASVTLGSASDLIGPSCTSGALTRCRPERQNTEDRRNIPRIFQGLVLRLPNSGGTTGRTKGRSCSQDISNRWVGSRRPCFGARCH